MSSTLADAELDEPRFGGHDPSNRLRSGCKVRAVLRSIAYRPETLTCASLIGDTMKAFTLSLLLAGAVASVFAMPPAGAPAGTTGMCNDGSFWSNAEKRGACRGHKGVKDWYESEAPMTAPAPRDRKSVV